MSTFRIQLANGAEAIVNGSSVLHTDGVLAVTEDRRSDDYVTYSITEITSGYTVGSGFKSRRRTAKIAKEWWSRLSKSQKHIVASGQRASCRDWTAMDWLQDQQRRYGNGY